MGIKKLKKTENRLKKWGLLIKKSQNNEKNPKKTGCILK